MSGQITTLVEVWNDPNPDVRREEHEKIRAQWPALADALDKLRGIHARQYEAAMLVQQVQNDEHRRISELVLGKDTQRGGRYVTELVKLGEDYLVQVKGGVMFGESDRLWWTFVVAGKASSAFNKDRESAILHLIATRHDPDPNSNHHAAFYAGRVLGLPEATE